MSGHPADDSGQRPDSNEDGDGLFGIDRRSVMKAAGASAGALFGGSTVIGSAVALTGSEDCFQVDLVQNDSSDIKDPVDDANKYNDEGRLISWQWGNWVDDNVDVGEDKDNIGTYSQACDVSVNSDISFDYTSNKADVTVDVSNCSNTVTETTLALLCYRAPCGDPNNPTWEGNTQPLFAETQQTISESDPARTLTVDIPPLPEGVPQRSSAEAYWPLDVIGTTNSQNRITGNEIGTNDGDTTISSTSNTPGDTGSAYDLNNDTSTDTLFDQDSLSINNSQATIAAWFNYDSSGTDDFGRILQVGGTATLDQTYNTTGGYNIEIDDKNSRLNMSVWNDANQADNAFYDTESINQNNWYFVVGVLDNSINTFRLHVFDTSGELSGSPVYGDDISRKVGGPVNLDIMGGNSLYVDGQVDEVYGFDAAFTRSQVTSLYNASVSDAPVTNTTQSNDYTSIQAAIDDANSNDTIQVASGTYNENIDITVSGLTLESTGDHTNTTIRSSGGANETLFIDADGVTVDGFTFTHGASSGRDGQPFHIATVLKSSSGSTFNDKPTIKNCVLDGANTAENGLLSATNTKLTNSTIKNAQYGLRLGIDDGSTVIHQPKGTDVTNVEFGNNGGLDGGGGGADVGGESDPNFLSIDETNISINKNNLRKGDANLAAFALTDGADLDLTNNYWDGQNISNVTDKDIDSSNDAGSAFTTGPQ
jgi:hypothetical protein